MSTELTLDEVGILGGGGLGGGAFFCVPLVRGSEADLGRPFWLDLFGECLTEVLDTGRGAISSSDCITNRSSFLEN